MKRIALLSHCVLIAFYFIPSLLKAQNQAVQVIRNFEFPTEIPLILDPKTGRTTYYSGSASKQTDRFESGSATITTEGPIKYTITPAFSINPNQNITWNGRVDVDMSQVTIGSWWTHKGKMTAAYTANFRRNGEMVTERGNVVVKFFIYELEAHLKPLYPVSSTNDTLYILKNGSAPAWVNFWPGTPISTVNFTTANNLVTAGNQNTGFSAGNGYTVIQAGNATGISSVILTVTAQGLSTSTVMPVRVIDDPTISGPDLVQIAQNSGQQVVVLGAPGRGTYQWTVSNGLQVQWDSGSKAMIRNRNADDGTITVRYTISGRTATKTIKVVTDPSVVILPTTMTLKIGKSAYVRASAVGFRTPTFNIQLRQGANAFVLVNNVDLTTVNGVSMGTASVEAIRKTPTMNTTQVEARYFTNGENPISAYCTVTIVDGLVLRANPTSVNMVNNVGSPRIVVNLTPTPARPVGTYTLVNSVDFVNVQLDANNNRLIITPLPQPREGVGVIKVRYTGTFNGNPDADEVEIPIRASNMNFNSITFTYPRYVAAEVLRTDGATAYTITALDGFGNNIAGGVQWKLLGQADKHVRNGTFVDFTIQNPVNASFNRTWDVWRRGGYQSAPANSRMDIRYWVTPNAPGMTNNKSNTLTNTIFKP